MSSRRKRIADYLASTWKRPETRAAIALILPTFVTFAAILNDRESLQLVFVVAVICSLVLFLSGEHHRRLDEQDSALDKIATTASTGLSRLETNTAGRIITVKAGGLAGVLLADSDSLTRLSFSISTGVSAGVRSDIQVLSGKTQHTALVFHAVALDTPDRFDNARRMPLLERSQMTRVVWEDKGRARLALYSEGADEWTVLPPTDSVNLIGSELQATEKKLAVSESFTDYEWVCATLNRDLISVRRLRKLAREGAVPVMGRRAIRVTQRDLTVDAKRVWAIDDSDPAGWVDESHLRNMLAYNGVIALGGEDVMRRIFVLPANPRDEHVRRDLGICLQVHRELGIACGLVERKDLDRELVGDNVLYNDAIVWQGGLDSTGKFFATSEKVEAFRSAFIELWNDPDLKPQEYCDEWIGDWEHRGATNADKEKVTLTLKVLNAEIREIIDRRVAEEKDSLGDGD